MDSIHLSHPPRLVLQPYVSTNTHIHKAVQTVLLRIEKSLHLSIVEECPAIYAVPVHHVAFKTNVCEMW